MVTANVHELKARFSEYARLVKRGERVVVCERNKPFAELRLLGEPTIRPPKRRLGQLKGQCPMTAEFGSSDAEIAADFLNGSIFPEKAAKRPKAWK
jgi:antitoxin (DNA-binding transcriptional repressor) of toxin-antitoxin stability system